MAVVQQESELRSRRTKMPTNATLFRVVAALASLKLVRHTWLLQCGSQGAAARRSAAEAAPRGQGFGCALNGWAYAEVRSVWFTSSKTPP